MYQGITYSLTNFYLWYMFQHILFHFFFLFIHALFVFFMNIAKGLSLLLTFKKYFCFIDLYLFIYLGWGKEELLYSEKSINQEGGRLVSQKPILPELQFRFLFLFLFFNWRKIDL